MLTRRDWVHMETSNLWWVNFKQYINWKIVTGWSWLFFQILHEYEWYNISKFIRKGSVLFVFNILTIIEQGIKLQTDLYWECI